MSPRYSDTAEMIPSNPLAVNGESDWASLEAREQSAGQRVQLQECLELRKVRAKTGPSKLLGRAARREGGYTCVDVAFMPFQHVAGHVIGSPVAWRRVAHPQKKSVLLLLIAAHYICWHVVFHKAASRRVG